MTIQKNAGESDEGGYTLIGADGTRRQSPTPGKLGGHRRLRIYGRLDCPAALRAISRGSKRTNRVFFADEDAAIAAGYRPCAVCLPAEYRLWKRAREAAADTAKS